MKFNPITRDIISDEDVNKLLFHAKSMDELPERRDTVMGDPNNEIAIVMQHGFIGSPLELLFIANELAKQFRVALPLLPGHGTHAKEMHGIPWQQWFAKNTSAIEYLKKEKDDRKIILVGHSLGGSISLMQSAQRDDIFGLIVLSAPIGIEFTPRFIIKLLRPFFGSKYIQFSKFIFHDERLYQQPLVKFLDNNYIKVSISTLYQLFNLITSVRPILPNIAIPILIQQSKYDKTVPEKNAHIIYENVQSQQKSIQILDKSYHIIMVDTDKEVVLQNIKLFLNDLLKS